MLDYLQSCFVNTSPRSEIETVSAKQRWNRLTRRVLPVEHSTRSTPFRDSMVNIGTLDQSNAVLGSERNDVCNFIDRDSVISRAKDKAISMANALIHQTFHSFCISFLKNFSSNMSVVKKYIMCDCVINHKYI